MAREITEVWVVRGAVGNVIAHVETEAEAATWRFGGNTIERLPLLTPHDAAVLEAAERYVLSNEEAWAKSSPDHLDRLRELVMASWPEGETLYDTLLEAVRARRAANAGGET